MIGALSRTLDRFLGRGEAAITVPPLDGALRPNRILDDAGERFALEGVDCLACVGGTVLASAGERVFALSDGGGKTLRFEAEAAITCIAPAGADGLAIALATGEIVIAGGAHDGKRLRAGPEVNCVTAMACADGAIHVANGSATNPAGEWQRDLLERNASGSVWRVDLESGDSACLARGLAWPSGLAIDGGIVVSEAWKHRLMRLQPGDPARAETLYHDLPGYPGRIAPAADGWWLAVFAPRSQLVEFVLREPVYRARMLAEVPGDYRVAPRLRTGRSFYEPLQGGGVKHLGMLKPWAPTMSAGLCVHLDAAFQPVASLHSRADGATHGVTSVVEAGGRVNVAARGDGVVVRVPKAAGGAP